MRCFVENKWFSLFLMGLLLVLAVNVSVAQSTGEPEPVKEAHDTVWVNYYNRLAKYLLWRDTEQAKEAALKALHKARNADYPAGEASAYRNLGILSYYSSQTDSAIAYYVKAKAAFQIAGNYSGEVNSIYHLAQACQKMGQWEGAIGYYRQLIDLENAVDDSIAVSGSLIKMGAVLMQMGQEHAADSAYRASLAIKRCMADSMGMLPLLTQLAAIPFTLNECPDTAYALYQEAFALACWQKNMHYAALCEDGMGEIRFRQACYRDALDLYYRALVKREKLEEKWGMAASLVKIGRVYEAQGFLNKADQFYHRGLELNRFLNDRKQLMKNYFLLAKLAIKRDQIPAAIEAFEQCLIQSKIANAPCCATRCYKNLLALYARLDMPDSVSRYQDLYRANRRYCSLPEEQEVSGQWVQESNTMGQRRFFQLGLAVVAGVLLLGILLKPRKTRRSL